MSGILAHIADRIIGRPLFIHAAKAQIILRVVAERIGVDPIEAELPSELVEHLLTSRLNKPGASRLVGEPGGPVDARGRKQVLYMQDGGIALIPIMGSLVNRGAWVGDNSGMMSYEGLDKQITAARDDPNVKAILLDIDSPGGEASGMFSLADTIRATRDYKPVVAHVNDWAMSAAYALASAATEIVGSPSSEVGSIGTVMMHVDRSHEMEKRGRRVTMIHAGAHKVDGNEFEPLSPSVRADRQRRVNEFNDRLIETVAAGRRQLSPAAIRALEAETFMGQAAKGIGLVDKIGSFGETLTRLKRGNVKGAFAMNDHVLNPGDTYSSVRMDASERTYSQAELDAAISENRKAAAAARAAVEIEEAKAAVTAARIEAVERVRGIINHEHAEGRRDQAIALALDTSLSVEEAGKVLKVSPRGTASNVPSVAERSAPQLARDEKQSQAQAVGSKWDRALSTAGAKL